MTDECWLFIILFSEDIPEFDALPFRNRHFDELCDLCHSIGRFRPNEPKEVQPSLEAVSFEAAMASEERF